jgi:hypothetical protein
VRRRELRGTTGLATGLIQAEIITEVRRQFNEIPGLKKCILMASEGLEIPPEDDVVGVCPPRTC